MFLVSFYATFASEGVPSMTEFQVPLHDLHVHVVFRLFSATKCYSNFTEKNLCCLPHAGNFVWSRPNIWLLCTDDKETSYQGLLGSKKILMSMICKHHIQRSIQDWSRQNAALTRALCVHGLKLASRSVSSRRHTSSDSSQLH